MGKCGDLDRATDLTPVGGGASCGMHESQSRLYGNMLGRELPEGKLLEQGIPAAIVGKITEPAGTEIYVTQSRKW